jgi:hypothetical protein
VLLVLFRYPVLPEEILSGQLAGQKYPIKICVAQPDGLLNNPADFWTAMDNELKPSLNYVVTLPLDVDVAFTAPVVRTKTIRFKAPDTDIEEMVQVAGMVYKAGKPGESVMGVRVVAREARMTADTDEKGSYFFPKLQTGKHTFDVLVSGKKVKEASVTVPAASYDLEI